MNYLVKCTTCNKATPFDAFVANIYERTKSCSTSRRNILSLDDMREMSKKCVCSDDYTSVKKSRINTCDSASDLMHLAHASTLSKIHVSAKDVNTSPSTISNNIGSYKKGNCKVVISKNDIHQASEKYVDDLLTKLSSTNQGDTDSKLSIITSCKRKVTSKMLLQALKRRSNSKRAFDVRKELTLCKIQDTDLVLMGFTPSDLKVMFGCHFNDIHKDYRVNDIAIADGSSLRRVSHSDFYCFYPFNDGKNPINWIISSDSFSIEDLQWLGLTGTDIVKADADLDITTLLNFLEGKLRIKNSDSGTLQYTYDGFNSSGFSDYINNKQVSYGDSKTMSLRDYIINHR